MTKGHKEKGKEQRTGKIKEKIKQNKTNIYI